MSHLKYSCNSKVQESELNKAMYSSHYAFNKHCPCFFINRYDKDKKLWRVVHSMHASMEEVICYSFIIFSEVICDIFAQHFLNAIITNYSQFGGASSDSARTRVTIKFPQIRFRTFVFSIFFHFISRICLF